MILGNMDDSDKGQHFLKDKKVLERELEISSINKDDKIIEIGAGTGVLTEELTRKAKEVLAFEIDEKFFEDLKSIGEKYENLTIVFDNALFYSWHGYNKIVSNIPYYLSEEVVNKAIMECVNEMVLIVGEKFKDLLFSNEKVGLVSRKFYSIKEIMKVSRESFEPQPRVNSFLIKFEKRRKISKLDNIILDIAFGNGKVKNSIMRALLKLKKTKRESRAIIKKMGLEENALEKPAKMITPALILKIEKEIERFK